VDPALSGVESCTVIGVSWAAANRGAIAAKAAAATAASAIAPTRLLKQRDARAEARFSAGDENIPRLGMIDLSMLRSNP
jgi:hypothetical protein